MVEGVSVSRAKPELGRKIGVVSGIVRSSVKGHVPLDALVPDQLPLLCIRLGENE